MSATNNPDSLPTPGYTTDPTAPYLPSPTEAKHYYHGLPSKPRLVARSSADAWVEPTGIEAYLSPKEARPIGWHPLQAIWEDRVGPAMIKYLDAMKVQFTSLDPVRMGYADESSFPVIIWIGVLPDSLPAEDGVKVAVQCKRILSDHDIDDVHVEIRESEVFRSAKLYKPVETEEPTARVIEPFSTALGLPICSEVTPYIEGTGGFYFSDPLNPGKLYFVTARHVLFHPDEDDNKFYEHKLTKSGRARKNVLLFGDAAIRKHTEEIELEIHNQACIVEILEKRLKKTETVRDKVQSQLDEARKAIAVLNDFLTDVTINWEKKENRVLGHVVLSPPIGFKVGVEGFTEDWAVVEINSSVIDSTNFVGNAIDLGTTIPIGEFRRCMRPNSAIPSSFEYPYNRLLQISGTLLDVDMWKLGPKTLDNDNDPCVMVIKRGNASGLTIGRLNTIRSFTRLYFNGKPGEISKEIVVLPRNCESRAFSKPGDSGAVIVDGKGRIAGLLTGGAGATDRFDCTYVTSINFLLNRMSEYGLKANLFPSLND